jgi:hypothetical protein
MGQKPPAKLESVKLGLIEKQSQHFFPTHRSNPSRADFRGSIQKTPKDALRLFKRLLCMVNVKQPRVSFLLFSEHP